MVLIEIREWDENLPIFGEKGSIKVEHGQLFIQNSQPLYTTIKPIKQKPYLSNIILMQNIFIDCCLGLEATLPSGPVTMDNIESKS